MDQHTFESVIQYLGTKDRANRFLEKISNIQRQPITAATVVNLQTEFTAEEMQYLPTDTHALVAQFNEMYSQIREVPILKITSAVKPSYIVQQSLIQTLHSSINELFLVDWQDRDTLIGGATFEYKGKIFDSSIKSKLESLDTV